MNKGLRNNDNIADRCPKCGSTDLLKQFLPDGQSELICLNLDCDFAQVLNDGNTVIQSKSTDFAGRLSHLTDQQLYRMQSKLADSSDTLSGRPQRLAKRQKALVNSEIRRRLQVQNNSAEGETRPGEQAHSRCTENNTQISIDSPKTPPQFNTPQAVLKRIEGIREYHRRKKGGRLKSAIAGDNGSATRWLDTMLKTLRHDASRHEKAAQNYARVPELFPLHIEHSARAFELNRILDFLTDYTAILEENQESG